MRKVAACFLAMVMLAGMIAFSACDGGGTGEVETYKIGAVFAATGFNSPLGTPEKQTAEMLEQQINDAGGIDGHQLDIIIYDTESDETKCLTSVKKLIEQDGVLAVIGPTSSGESLAILDTITQAEVPLVSCAASSKIVEPVDERYWVFKTPQSDTLAVGEIYAYLTDQGISKIALITDSGGYGSTGREQLVALADDWDMTIVADEKFGTQDTDMTSQLTSIRGTEAEAVICWGTNPGPSVIAQNMQALGMDLPLLNSHGIANKQFIDLAGDAANGVIFPAGKLLVADQLPDTDPQKEVLVSYKEDFEALYGEGTTNTFGGHAYDAIMMLVSALEEVGPDSAAIRDALENITEFPGTGGVFNMSATDHNGLSAGAFVLIEVVDGEWVWLQD